MPELPESDIRRIVRRRLTEGILNRATGSLRPVTSVGGRSCSVCGFSITLGRNECQVAGNVAALEHRRVVWPSDRGHPGAVCRRALAVDIVVEGEASCGSSASSATEGLLDQSLIGAQGRQPHNSLRLHHGLSGWRLGAETPVKLAFD
jgi:hypothetical protein